MIVSLQCVAAPLSGFVALRARGLLTQKNSSQAPQSTLLVDIWPRLHSLTSAAPFPHLIHPGAQLPPRHGITMGPAYHRRKAAGLLSVRGTALFVIAVGLVALVVQIHHRKADGGMGSIGTTMLAQTAAAGGGGSGGGACHHRYVKSLPFVENRDAIGRMLEEEEGMETGIELGVQRGAYAETILSQWTKCKKYILVRCMCGDVRLGWRVSPSPRLGSMSLADPTFIFFSFF